MTIRSTVDVVPDGATRTRSPTAHRAADDPPAKPRKSRSGRLTHCTGIRNEPPPATSATSTDSRCCSSVGPSYHGVRSLGTLTLSPCSAEIGMHVTSCRPIARGERRYSASMPSNTSSE